MRYVDMKVGQKFLVGNHIYQKIEQKNDFGISARKGEEIVLVVSRPRAWGLSPCLTVTSLDSKMEFELVN